MVMLHDELVKHDDLIIMTLGTPMGHAGGTNAMKIIHVGNSLK